MLLRYNFYNLAEAQIGNTLYEVFACDPWKTKYTLLTKTILGNQ